ncbi:fibronectin type III domain-containing protein [Actinoplanes sp. LDG1-06]|uniref:Fibronectin type III domain-containing protein n=1 Tax=Paractinoplanes ovalisporus TaxID=2810368 RepID=A0ABS2AKU6_9ACTN|nr:fibronectin type III domain-containing protein [Actinoplanes ovalisporus]MBM2620477.1 fibronectin type III domain-containing protein [Actinoplanes ovalisporus]
MGTVLSLAGGLGLTVLGLGSADQAVASFDAASWVWSKAKGEVARINGVTAKVDTRVDVPKARGHQVQVVQNDRFVILRDVTTGAIGSMDLTTLQEYWNASSTSGIGVRVALHEDAVFVIDTVQGQVQQLDPRTLGALGNPLRFPPGITGGVFDGKGKLWIAAPSEGTVTAITPAAVNSSEAAAPKTPVQSRTEPVAQPAHDLTLSTLEDGVAVLDRTTNALHTVRDSEPGFSSATLPLAGPGAMAPHTDGKQVPVTVPDSRQVYVVRDKVVSSKFVVPGDSDGLQPAVAWEGYFYVADNSGQVHVFDSAGRRQKDISFPNPGGPLELEVREGYLFINAPGSSIARVVDNSHAVRTVDKYADDVLGGDRPPAPPQAPPPPPKPKKPVVSKPSAPRNVRAAAGNAEARVTWQSANDNNAAITRYVVVGAGRTFQVGADQRALTVTGLINGQTYQFAVSAVNKKGQGPARTSNAVKPTSEVPDAPTAVTAEAKPDGTVVVSWPPANGQGLEIRRYTVTAISEGGSAPIGDSAEASLTIKDGQLEYGKQYAFTVVSINERGAGSKASPVSGSVVPYNKPGKPEGTDAATAGDQAGSIQVAWQPAADNGRPITKYVVSAGGKSTDVTDGTATTLTGFDSGATVAVEVRAVNEAGEGEPGTATARTVALPRITMTGVNPTFNTATVSFSVDAGGGTASCSVAASGGGGTASGSCSSLKVASLKPSTKYTFTVTAKNAAGTVTAQSSATTDALYGIATCKNGQNGETATYCDKDVDGRNGNEIFSVTKQDDDKQVGWAKPGTRLQAYCKKSGESIYAYIYNNEKRSTWWIQVNYSGKNYIPWAWLNLEGGDDLNDLPTC